MKKIFTKIGMLTTILFSQNAFSQDVVVGWSFPDTSANSVMDTGLAINSARFISCERGSGFNVLTIDYTFDGAEYPVIADDKCATVSEFENGADSVYWMIKFRSTGYTNLRFSSKQWSSLSPAGPGDFKVQYKLSGGSSPWNDLTQVTLSNDWTTGEVMEFSLPAECDNQSSNVSLRWIMTSNTDIQGGTVVAGAQSKIDDIFVIGDAITGINDNDATPSVMVYPNPNRGQFNIEHHSAIRNIQISDALGRIVFSSSTIMDNKLTINNLTKGVYILNIGLENGNSQIQKIIVE